MKFEWEEKDIVPGRVVRSKSGNEQAIIGYHYGSSGRDTETRYCLVLLNDGTICRTDERYKQSMAEHLTKHGYVPFDFEGTKRASA